MGVSRYLFTTMQYFPACELKMLMSTLKRAMKIKARLAAGEVVELKKDCGCLDEIHVGPHWLHMDDFQKRRNAGLIKSALDQIETARDLTALIQAHTLIHKVSHEEIARLEEKIRNMTRAGIEEIIRA